MKTVVVRLALVCVSLIIIGLMLTGQCSAKIDAETIVGIWLLDEGTGEVAKDSSGRGHDGKLMNGPKWLEGKFGKALESDGKDDYVDTGDSDAFDFGAGNYALSVWAKMASTAIAIKMHFVGKDNSGGGKRQFSMGYNWPSRGTIVTEFFNSGDAVAYLATDGGEINDTNWHHLVGQRRGGGFEIYVDGTLVKSGTTSGTPGTMQETEAHFLIGAREYSGNEEPFTGIIDEVAVFNVALTENDIKSIMTKGLKTMLAVSPKEKLSTTWSSIKSH